jgi:DNA excision repair protein ERCC-3
MLRYKEWISCTLSKVSAASDFALGQGLALCYTNYPMGNVAEKPIILQSDRSVLLEVDNPSFEDARDALSVFAELVKSPEHFHTYRITPLSLWNAAAAGHTAEEVLAKLREYSRYGVPQNIEAEIYDAMARYGRIRLERLDDKELVLRTDEPMLALELWNQASLRSFFLGREGPCGIRVPAQERGNIKCALIKLGWPVEDLAGYVEGTPLDVALRPVTLSGRPFALRPYQRESIAAFHAGGSNRGGSGVVVLPCGAGKTIVAIGAIALAKTSTLILTTNTVALRQWRNELLDKTTLTEDQIGEYSGDLKEIKPVTIATYQMLTYRKGKDSPFIHLDLFDREQWGLIVYDEVHLLPAPVFRATASLQSKRRLGLTATLVREDAREDDVFSLIGPKKYDVPWKVLEKQGWIAQAECFEIRVPLPQELRHRYAVSNSRMKFRMASTNPIKDHICGLLIEHHQEDNVLIIGQFLDQLKALKKRFNAPIITGSTATKERERLYRDFREGKIHLLIVSKVANFAIDLPDANVAIQVSGTFGSRQEEAQRLGRILRPKSHGNAVARFYSLVSRDTSDQEFSMKRQLFLTEQGYRYRILPAEDIEKGEFPQTRVESRTAAGA